MAASGLQVAGLRRQAAAGAIDLGLVGVPAVAVSGGVAWLYIKYVRGDDESAGLRPLKQSRRVRLASSGFSVAVGIAARNWRSPGYRALGLRRADVRTGGPVSLRSAVVQSVVTTAWTQSVRLLAQPYTKRNQEGVEAAALPCLPILGSVAVLYLSAVWSPLNQTLPERLAGIVVVED